MTRAHKKIAAIAAAAFGVCLLFFGNDIGSSGTAKPSGIHAPAAAGDLHKKNYKTVVTSFTDAGFTKVETVVLEDLVTGWLVKDGSVETVSINGDLSFTTNETFASGARVVVTYHTFKSTPEPSSSTSESARASSKPSAASVTSAAKAAASTSAPATSKAAPVTGTEANPLTAANNADLAKLLKLTNESDPFIAEFAAKYAGQVIAFDGCVTAMNLHDSSTTRYDIMINAGNFDPNKSRGPAFQFNNVNTTSDVNIIGDNPGSIGVGSNIHVVATVGTVKDPLFHIDPVSVSFR